MPQGYPVPFPVPKPHLRVLGVDPPFVRVRATCQCGASADPELSLSGFRAWCGGTNIQDALPEVPAPLRELLISGTCDACWRELFPPEEEDEEPEPDVDDGVYLCANCERPYTCAGQKEGLCARCEEDPAAREWYYQTREKERGE